jgi:hypothetical protein
MKIKEIDKIIDEVVDTLPPHTMVKWADTADTDTYHLDDDRYLGISASGIFGDDDDSEYFVSVDENANATEITIRYILDSGYIDMGEVALKIIFYKEGK